MGSSNSKTIHAGVEEKVGPEIFKKLNEILEQGGNISEIVNSILQLPKMAVPVPNNIADSLRKIIPMIADTIRPIIGISKEQLSDAAITTLFNISIEFAAAAIPYCAAIVVLIATAGNGIAAWETYSQTNHALQMVMNVETAIMKLAETMESPEFVKSLGRHFEIGKKMFANILQRIASKTGSKEDPYRIVKFTYGRKMGSCDCEKFGPNYSGGSDNIEEDEEIGLKAAVDYLETSSSAAKRGLAKKIITTMGPFMKTRPPKSLSLTDQANWLLNNMFERGDNKNSIDPEKLDPATDALIGLLNEYLGQPIINKNLPKEVKAAQAAEILHSLITSMHIEFLVAQRDILIIDENLKVLGEIQESIVNDISALTSKEMSESDRVTVAASQEALKLINEENARQRGMLTAITTGKFTTADVDVMKMLAEGNLLKMHIDEISESNPSKASFQKLLYKLVNMTILTGAVAVVIENALKLVGISVEEYRKMSNIGQLKNVIANKSIENKRSLEDNYKFFKAAEMLEQNFNTTARQSLGMRTSNATGIVGAYSGGAGVITPPRPREFYPKTEVEKKIENQVNLRAAQIRTFANEFENVYNAIKESVDALIPFVGDTIDPTPDLDQFVLRLRTLVGDKELRGKTYETMAGAVVDSLATQLRSETINDYKSIIAMGKKVLEGINERGRAPLLNVIESMESLIRLSDKSVEEFKIFTGGADISESILPHGGIARSMIDLEQSIDKLDAAIKVAKVRQNVRGIMTNFQGVTADYERRTGESIAGVINDINMYQQKMTQIISPDNKFLFDFMVEQCNAMTNLWRAAEATDYYLGNFTHDIRLNASEINDINALMEDISVQKEVYDAKLGNLFTSIFDCFPSNVDPLTGAVEYPSAAVANNNGKAHYYTLFSRAENVPGNPIYGADVQHGEAAIKRTKAFISKFTIFRNIVNVFYNIGSKYGKNKTKESTKYMSAGALLKSLVEYIYTGSFMIVDTNVVNHYGEFIQKIQATFPGGFTSYDANGPTGNANMMFQNMEKMDLFYWMRNNPESEYRKLDAICREFYNSNPLDIAENMYHMPTDGNGLTYDPLTRNTSQGLIQPGTNQFIYMRSDTYNFLRGDAILVKTDDMFVLLIKAMLAKIIACIETFEIMKKPTMYNVSNSGVRQILGGSESPSLRPEYTELYIRLPLLVRFYKEIFKMDKGDDNDFVYGMNIDKSRSKYLKISILPDIDGVYGGLVKYMFTNDKRGISNYTDSQMGVIVEKINAIIDSVGGKNVEDTIKKVIQGFIREINRRFTLVTKEDYDNYKKLEDQEHNLWGAMKLYNANDYDSEFDNMLTNVDDDIDVFMRVPSDSYVTNGPGHRGIFGADYAQTNADKTFYREYYSLYNNFRKMVDSALLSGVKNKPKLSNSIETLKKRIGAEPKVYKKLELLSSFLSENNDLNKYSRAKYIAFHELIIASLNSLSIIDSFLTNIITLGYMVDPNGLGDALVLFAEIQRLAPGTGLPFNAYAASLEGANPAPLATGISRKVITKFANAVGGGVNALQEVAAAGDTSFSLQKHVGKWKPTAFADAGSIRTFIGIIGPAIIESIYAMTGNKLFNVRLNEGGLSVDFDLMKDTVEKLYAATKSTLEKFRPHIDPAFFELYVGIIEDDQRSNTVYRIYDDLIRIKLQGVKVAGVNPNNNNHKLDIQLKNYYSIANAIGAINNFIKTVQFKTNDIVATYVRENMCYIPGTDNLGLSRPATIPANATLVEMNKWYSGIGSGIERMLMSINGDKTTMDLRFAGKFKGLYTWDREFSFNRNLFSAMNQLIARFLSRSFDPNLEKIYKGVIAAFDKAFPNEITEPFLNTWPDFWPAVYLAKGNVPRNTVSEKDNYSVSDGMNDYRTFVAAAASTYKVTLISDVTNNDIKMTLGYQGTDLPEITEYGDRPLPNVEKLLYGSLAQIVKNIKSNRNSAGGNLNMAESLSEISQTIKERMKEEIPIFKKYFAELGNRAKFLLEFVEHFTTLNQLRVPVARPVSIYPIPPETVGDEEKTYYIRLLTRIIEIAEVFEKATDDLHIDLGIGLEYGELFAGFLKSYQSRFSVTPYVPMSMILGYVFNGNNMLKERNSCQFLPSTKSTAARYLSNFVNCANKVSTSPIVNFIIERFKTAVNGPEEINLEDAKNIVDGYIKLMLYVGECRQFKSAFSTIRHDVASANMVGDISVYVYPERVDSGQKYYTKIPQNAYTVAPWTFGFYVSDSATTRPGIILSYQITNYGTYVNSYFATKNVVDYVNILPISDTEAQYGPIVDMFDINSNTTNSNNFMIANILDMNIVPIDFSEFSRFIPMSNIMNYAYTMDRMMLDILVPNPSDRKRIYQRIIDTDEVPLMNTESIIYALLVNPFAKLNFDARAAPAVIGFIDNMFLGNHEINLGRPKFLSDQMYQKAFFGLLYQGHDQYNGIGRRVPTPAVGLAGDNLNTFIDSTQINPTKVFNRGLPTQTTNQNFGTASVRTVRGSADVDIVEPEYPIDPTTGNRVPHTHLHYLFIGSWADKQKVEGRQRTNVKHHKIILDRIISSNGGLIAAGMNPRYTAGVGNEYTVDLEIAYDPTISMTSRLQGAYALVLQALAAVNPPIYVPGVDVAEIATFNSGNTLVDFNTLEPIGYARGRNQGQVKPKGIYKYFNKAQFDPNNPNLVTNSATDNHLIYINPKAEGANRLVRVTLPNGVSYATVGLHRLHTVLSRTLIFVLNAYRITMMRLRSDRSSGSKISTSANDVLDENDTEFYGFDMIE